MKDQETKEYDRVYEMRESEYMKVAPELFSKECRYIFRKFSTRGLLRIPIAGMKYEKAL